MDVSINTTRVRESFWWKKSAVIIISIIAALLLVPPLFGLKTAYLWTDYLFFLIIFVLIIFISYIRTQVHLSSAWKQVFTNKVAMVSAVVLLSYIFIAVLDSLHFQPVLKVEHTQSNVPKQVNYSPVESALDLILIPMRQITDEQGNSVFFPLRLRDERTYSAPMATHAFAKETVNLGKGKVRREYPKLKYGGSHLKPGQSKGLDILVKILTGFLIAGFVWSLLVVFLVLVLSRFKLSAVVSDVKRLFKGEHDIPWNVAAWTLLVIFMFSFSLFWLSFYYHVLGTDKVGEDTLYQAVKSIRTGIIIGTLTTLVMLPFAIFLGIAAGYFKGWVDDLIQYLYTTLSSIPGVLLIAASVLMIQVYIDSSAFQLTDTDNGDIKLLALTIILGITSWTSLCRLLRGESLRIREVEYIQAAQAFGVRDMAIIRRHIIPNIMHIVLIVVVLDFSGLVLAEAVLSYIGIGVDAKMNSWGNMINGARLEMARDPMVWWSLVAAMSFMFTLVLAANMFSDAVRDAFDPRLRKA